MLHKYFFSLEQGFADFYPHILPSFIPIDHKHVVEKCWHDNCFFLNHGNSFPIPSLFLSPSMVRLFRTEKKELRKEDEVCLIKRMTLGMKESGQRGLEWHRWTSSHGYSEQLFLQGQLSLGAAHLGIPNPCLAHTYTILFTFWPNGLNTAGIQEELPGRSASPGRLTDKNVEILRIENHSSPSFKSSIYSVLILTKMCHP